MSRSTGCRSDAGAVAGVRLVQGGGPAGEQRQPVGRGGVGLGAVDHQRHPRVGRHGHGLERQVQLTDHGVMDVLEAGAVEADVVGGPAAGELVTAGGQLPDEIGEGPVVRVPAGLAAQHRHDVVRRPRPVEEEGVGAGVEEDEPGDVHRAGRVEVHLRIERVAEPVGGEDVAAGVPHVRRHPGHGVEGLLDAGPDLLRAGPPPGSYGAVGRPGQVEQMDPLGLVELQRGGQGVEDALGDPAEIAPLEPDVVVDADPGEQGDLLPAEPGDASVAAVRGQAGPIRADPGPPRAQELARLLPVVHTPDPTGAPAAVGGPVSTWVGGAAPVRKRTWPTGDNSTVTSFGWRPRRLR